MKDNVYMKLVLTVIAICLIAILLRDIKITPMAQAVSDRGDNVVKVQIVSIDESPSLAWETLPVENK